VRVARYATPTADSGDTGKEGESAASTWRSPVELDR